MVSKFLNLFAGLAFSNTAARRMHFTTTALLGSAIYQNRLLCFYVYTTRGNRGPNTAYCHFRNSRADKFPLGVGRIGVYVLIKEFFVCADFLVLDFDPETFSATRVRTQDTWDTWASYCSLSIFQANE